MRLVDDWQRSLGRGLAFWMQFLGLLALVVPEARFLLTGRDSDPVFLWCLGVLLILAGMGGRLVKQDLPLWREWLRIAAVGLIAGMIAALLAGQAFAGVSTAEKTLKVAVPLIAKFEGKRNKAYLDIVGVPTICYGSTSGVRLGMVKTDAECTRLLRAEVTEYRSGLHRYFSKVTKASRLTPERDAAYTSLAFNCGVGAIGRSTAVRRLNAGDIRGGCKAITWWNKAGKRVRRGLTIRRGGEYRLCVAGL